MSLPYKTPDNELSLNLAILLVIIAELGKSSRGKLLLNNERLQLCFHFLKNPVVLNAALAAHDKTPAQLRPYDAYSVASISKNLDPLHDGLQLKVLLRRAAATDLITVEYRKAEGFMYDLTDAGRALVDGLEGEYFDSLRTYAHSLTQLNSVSTSSLYELADAKTTGTFL